MSSTILKYLLVLTLGGVALSTSAGTLKKWVDDKGVIHYGDAPPARGLTLEDANVKRESVQSFGQSSSGGSVPKSSQSSPAGSSGGYWRCEEYEK